jgi:hypothetical protein
MADRKTFQVDDAQFKWRNFSGREEQFNRKGSRYGVIFLPTDVAEQMLADGWNVKQGQLSEEDEEAGADPRYHIQIAARFDPLPPNIWLVTKKNRIKLEEDELDAIDSADIKIVDVICNGSEWSVNGKTGIKAYIKTMFVTINEDPLEEKYKVHEPLNQQKSLEA